MIRRRVVCTLLWTALAGPSLGAQLPSSSPYAAALDQYRRGQFQAAADALIQLPDKDLDAAHKALRDAFKSASVEKSARAEALMRVAALAHTEAAMALRLRNDRTRWNRHIGLARDDVEAIESRKRDDPFARQWWLLVISYLHYTGQLAEAEQFARDARDAGGDTPDLLLAFGATHELAWTWAHDAEMEYSFKGDLKRAENAYRAALSMPSAHLETRVRLARVLILGGAPDRALPLLAEIGTDGDPGFLYLARLFEGDAFERRGDYAEAERSYRAAIDAMPVGQSAQIALAQLHHTRGARAAAHDTIRALAGDRDSADTSDPWYWYMRGMGWRADGYLSSLRAAVRQ